MFSAKIWAWGQRGKEAITGSLLESWDETGIGFGVEEREDLPLVYLLS